MGTEIVDVAQAVPSPILEANHPRPGLLRWFELFLVLLVSFGNFILTSLNLLAGGRGRAFSSQDLQWTVLLIQEITALLLLGYVLARRRLRIQDLGLRWSWRELGAGVLMTGASYLAYILGYGVLTYVHQVLFASPARGASTGQIFGYPSVMMLAFILLNPFFEELIVRAFLMTEIKALTGSWVWAVVVSVAVQTAYHLYYGWTVALALGCQFLVFSIYFTRTRRATPVIFSHLVFDLVGALRLF